MSYRKTSEAILKAHGRAAAKVGRAAKALGKKAAKPQKMAKKPVKMAKTDSTGKEQRKK